MRMPAIASLRRLDHRLALADWSHCARCAEWGGSSFEVNMLGQRASAVTAIVTMLVAAGVSSCSSSSSSQPPAGSQQLAAATECTPCVSLQKTEKGTRIFGPQLELLRDDKVIRGQSPSGIFDISPTKDDFSGMIGTGTTNIHVEPTTNGNFNMRGMLAGAMGNLEVSDDRIQGQLGRCQFDLKAMPPTDSGRGYTGQRICGGMRATTTMKLSPQILALNSFDRAAVITLMLVR